MARLCERPGCSIPAEVSYGFDADLLVVWLDTFAGQISVRSGVLCLRHANAMVVPLGWMLDDRREPVPRLFRSPATASADEVRHRSRRATRSPRATPDDTEQLLLDPALVEAILDDEVVRVETDDTDPTAWSDGDRPADVAPDLGSDEAADDLDDQPVAIDGVQPWQPMFDQSDDLHGLLKTRGSLLSRAFNGTPRTP